MEDTDMAGEDTANSAPLSTSNLYIPPSVNQTAVLSGDSYTYYSPIPPCLNPSPVPSTSSSSSPCSSSSSNTHTNPLPTETASPDSQPVCLGIDEAGRGPVLGPMVYAAFYLPLPLSDPLLRETHHFDDSKALTPATRTHLMRTLCSPQSSGDTSLSESCGFAIRALSARDISSGMLKTAMYNLNAQAFDATVEIIRGVMERGVRVEEVYVDTVGQPAAYQARLERVFPRVKITVAKKADSLYPCVSAASVCAKVTRDAALEVLYMNHSTTKGPGEGGQTKGDEDMAWGSGYPSDARCQSWLRNNMHPVFGWGPECRFSWGTAKDMLDGKGGVKVEWPVDEDDGENNRLTEYFITSVSAPGGGKGESADELGTWFGRPAGMEAF